MLVNAVHVTKFHFTLKDLIFIVTPQFVSYLNNPSINFLASANGVQYVFIDHIGGMKEIHINGMIKWNWMSLAPIISTILVFFSLSLNNTPIATTQHFLFNIVITVMLTFNVFSNAIISISNGDMGINNLN